MIYINARFLTQKITGVQRFAREISKKLISIRKDIVFLVPSLSEIIHDETLDGFTIIEVKGGGGHYWEQITLPLYLLKNNSPLLISLCNVGPVFYRNQVITLHDITFVKYPQSYSKKFRLVYGLITPILLKNSKVILTVSDFSKNDIAENFKVNANRIKVIYNSVSEVFKEYKKNDVIDSEAYILAVSSQNYHKNFHGLIRAFSKYNGKLQLKIIGGKTKAFSGIGLDTNDERVSFLGRVSDEELARLYSGATCFIFPSLYEGFGIPPIEAQVCGCPVLSSDRASMKEVLRDSAVYFNPENDDEIISAINRVYADEKLRKSLIVKGELNAQRFSWYESASKLNTIINTLI
ncbi:glycosyltransferase family 1 protein [Klebsiella aerogenes]|uniref:glycosyltransferase family 4 protein n=1 Tax=Klebsiella aerogenes TaxID=548 RepID=UPI0025512F76|nr:glycosyltransferase family 1 protein [Klebsiella aerogenes]MDK6929009.1 glycosyltransferase family 1 protein [Klebsiella aerogenes]